MSPSPMALALALLCLSAGARAQAGDALAPHPAPAATAAHAHSDGPAPNGQRGRVTCQPLGQHAIGETGCYIVAQEPIGVAPAGPLYWHLDTFPDAAAARAARGPNGSVLDAYGRVWLLTVAGARWRPAGGTHVASIGPFRPLTDGPQLATYMVATSDADMDSPPHTHPGPEAFYVLEGAQCLETPDGIQRAHAGQGLSVAGGVPMQLYGAGTTTRKALVLVLHDAAQPVIVRNPGWQGSGRCLSEPQAP